MARAQLVNVTDPGPQSVFFGEGKKISAIFHNPGGQDFKSNVRVRIFQASSATVIPLGERPWKELRVLSRQTILESASLDFPPVKAGTKFLVQWLENTHRIIGKTEVLVYPTNLLDDLEVLVNESTKNLGVLDPRNQLKPALKHSAIGFVDLAETEMDAFSGKLAVVGPCAPDDPEWSGLAERIRKLARKGTAVVWIQWPSQMRDKIRPSFYFVPQYPAVVLVIQPELVVDLVDNPQSQLNLIYFCQLSLNPQPFPLPNPSSQP